MVFYNRVLKTEETSFDWASKKSFGGDEFYKKRETRFRTLMFNWMTAILIFVVCF